MIQKHSFTHYLYHIDVGTSNYVGGEQISYVEWTCSIKVYLCILTGHKFILYIFHLDKI